MLSEAAKGPSEAELLPLSQPSPVRKDTPARSRVWRTARVVCLWIACVLSALRMMKTGRVAVNPAEAAALDSVYDPSTFYHSVSRAESICPSVVAGTPSHAGYIGLEGDSESTKHRSFFWYFEAEQDAENAPLILTFGGGPGTSGLTNPVFGQSHCVVTENGTVPNPNRWTEKFNLLALDYPIGAGFSEGFVVNNSRAAAHQAYEFLQKFFVLFPHLAENQFVISSGSYGGAYVPNLATVIHEQNKAIARGEGQPGAVPINLESVALSNPASSPKAMFSWTLYYDCELHNVYNATQCAELYAILPECLEKLDYALDAATSTAASRSDAYEFCTKFEDGDMHGRDMQDIRKTGCDNRDITVCYPQFRWMADFFHSNETRKVLGVPQDAEWAPVNSDLNMKFARYGDLIFNHHKLYEPLLAEGIRVLHNVGMQDANVAWPGTLSFLKLLHSPFSADFRAAEDVPWPSADAPAGTVRVAGPGGAGSFTFLTYAEAGHFVTLNQPALTKYVIEHWVENAAFA